MESIQRFATLALFCAILPFSLIAQNNVGLAPSHETLITKLPGQTILETYFIDETSFYYEGFFGLEYGNWSYAVSAPDVGVVTQTYDADGNDPAIYREETILTFLSTTSGTYIYREYFEGAKDFEDSGEFDFPWLAVSASPVWVPEGWVYFSWPYVYSISDGRWRFFNTENTQLRVNLSDSQWGTLADATGWNYYAWPYSYSVDQSTWHWYTSDTQWVVDLTSGVWSLFGDSGN